MFGVRYWLLLVINQSARAGSNRERCWQCRRRHHSLGGEESGQGSVPSSEQVNQDVDYICLPSIFGPRFVIDH